MPQEIRCIVDCHGQEWSQMAFFIGRKREGFRLASYNGRALDTRRKRSTDRNRV